MHENSQETANLIDAQDVSGALETTAESVNTTLAEVTPVQPAPEISSPAVSITEETPPEAAFELVGDDQPMVMVTESTNHETPPGDGASVEAFVHVPSPPDTPAPETEAHTAVTAEEKHAGGPTGQEGKRSSQGARKARKGGGHGSAPIRVIPPKKVVKVLSVGMEVPGVVRRVADFGAFVDIGVGTDGLVHVSEMAASRVTKASDLLKEGDEVTVWIKELDRDRNRISLTMVAPGTKTIRDLQEGDIVTGKVTRVVPYAAFVDIGIGRDGMLHIREMAEGYVKRVEDVVNIGDDVEVRIIGLDRRRQRIDLSVKGLVPEPVYESAPPVIDAEEERPARERPRSRDRQDGGYPEETADNRSRDRRDRRTNKRQRGRSGDREEWYDYKAEDEDMGPTAMALALQAALANEPVDVSGDERRGNKKSRRESQIYRDEQEDIIDRTLRQHRQPV